LKRGGFSAVLEGGESKEKSSREVEVIWRKGRGGRDEKLPLVTSNDNTVLMQKGKKRKHRKREEVYHKQHKRKES